MSASRLGRREGLKRAYRVLFDAMEEWTTLMAHDILVNSHFTAAAFQSTFRSHAPPRLPLLCPGAHGLKERRARAGARQERAGEGGHAAGTPAPRAAGRVRGHGQA